jgi:hypothetical protein
MGGSEAADLGATIGTALARVRGPDAASMLPTFQALEARVGELPAEGDIGLLVRGLIYDGGFAAAYAGKRFSESLHFAEQACTTLRQQPGVETSYARASNNRGLARLELGHLVEAEADFRAALEILASPAVRNGALDAAALMRSVQDNLDILAFTRTPDDIRARLRTAGPAGEPAAQMSGFMPSIQRLAQSTNAALAALPPRPG